MQRSMFKDRERQRKSLIDENKAEVFNQRICYAMESNLAVKLTVWGDGFTKDVSCHVHYVDPIDYKGRAI
jgi:hypothetical protein